MATDNNDNSHLPHIWFCDTCKRKGDMLNKFSGNLVMAARQHLAISPDCLGVVCSVPAVEADSVPGIGLYLNWME